MKLFINNMEKQPINYSHNLDDINKELSEAQTKNGEKYHATEILGSGTFGIVFKAIVIGTNETVAIKKVYQDRRYKNRELQILKELNHPNSIKLFDYFYTANPNKEDEIYLNCVTDYCPEVLSKLIRKNAKSHQQLNLTYVKLYAFQMLKSLAYIHAIGVCHRDIKPQNILINPLTQELKLCDFGSAKKLVKGEANIAYICSRYYRAPELIFGATEYTNQIDVWSIGCVIAELVLGRPLFPGESASDQLVEIIKVLGTPSKEEIYQMNPESKEYKFPQIKSYPWEKVFKNRTVSDTYIDLIKKLLVYSPSLRLTPLKAMCHPFFDELRTLQNKQLPNGETLPSNLFVFTPPEINSDPESVHYLANIKK